MTLAADPAAAVPRLPARGPVPGQQPLRGVARRSLTPRAGRATGRPSRYLHVNMAVFGAIVGWAQRVPRSSGRSRSCSGSRPPPSRRRSSTRRAARSGGRTSACWDGRFARRAGCHLAGAGRCGSNSPREPDGARRARRLAGGVADPGGGPAGTARPVRLAAHAPARPHPRRDRRHVPARRRRPPVRERARRPQPVPRRGGRARPSPPSGASWTSCCARSAPAPGPSRSAAGPVPARAFADLGPGARAAFLRAPRPTARSGLKRTAFQDLKRVSLLLAYGMDGAVARRHRLRRPDLGPARIPRRCPVRTPRARRAARRGRGRDRLRDPAAG